MECTPRREDGGCDIFLDICRIILNFTSELYFSQLLNIMKSTHFIIILFVVLLSVGICGCNKEESAQSPKLEEIYDELDAEIARSAEYELIKDNRILNLRKELATCHDEYRRTELLNRLVDEYNAYNADSALYYVNLNLNRDIVKMNPEMERRLLIKRADIMAHAGMFPDAQKVLASISPNEVEPTLKEDYYATYCALYQYLSEYNSNHETAGEYEHRRALYTDSLNRVVDPASFNHMVYVMTETARNGQPDKAITMLKSHLSEYPLGSREYSILASTLSYIYKTSNHPDEYKYYLALSAISDVKAAVKENMSFREAATAMFEDGDVDRANRYLKKSIADANFFAGMMRNVQSTKMLPVIDDAYSARQHSLTRRLRIMVLVTGALSLILIITIGYILKQFRSVRRANEKVRAANEELSNLSAQLKSANEALTDKNAELSRMSDDLKVANTSLTEKNKELHSLSEELSIANKNLATRNSELNDYNRTKELYAGMFMENCATAISSFLQYQKSLRVLATQGSRPALMKKLESSEMADKMLKNFYGNFDEAILNIYPDFIENFNALLKPGCEVAIKNGEILNTELRLFSLIRLGIDDNAKIANFLRCSISTIYTYRSKVKKRAKNPETFEDDVRMLCLTTLDLQ